MQKKQFRIYPEVREEAERIYQELANILRERVKNNTDLKYYTYPLRTSKFGNITYQLEFHESLVEAIYERFLKEGIKCRIFDCYDETAFLSEIELSW